MSLPRTITDLVSTGAEPPNVGLHLTAASWRLAGAPRLAAGEAVVGQTAFRRPWARPLNSCFLGLIISYPERPASSLLACDQHMPSRGTGHYEMPHTLSEGRVRCSFKDSDGSLEVVVSSPSG